MNEGARPRRAAALDTAGVVATAAVWFVYSLGSVMAPLYFVLQWTVRLATLFGQGPDRADLAAAQPYGAAARVTVTVAFVVIAAITASFLVRGRRFVNGIVASSLAALAVVVTWLHLGQPIP